MGEHQIVVDINYIIEYIYLDYDLMFPHSNYVVYIC